jgi:AcrR family transcriptional regulator
VRTEAAPTTGRPRDPALDAAILAATRDLLVEHGFEGTTVEAVARAAGSGKAAVYRRWPSKTALVVAAVRDLYDPPPTPDTGSLRDDLLACARQYTRGDATAARVLASLLSEIGRDPELRQAAYESIGGPAAAPFHAVLERWRAAGAIGDQVPLDLLEGLVPAYAFRSVTLRGATLDDSTVTYLVDHVLLPALQPR